MSKPPANRERLLGANIINLSICYQHLSAKINRALEPVHLNMTQMSILNYLARLPEGHPETVTHISQVMDMNQPVVTKSIKAMHQQGLIDKKAGIEDSRVSHLYLNAFGKKRLVEAQQACVPLLEHAYEGLNMKELEQLVSLLSKVKSSLTE